jgi:tRNA A37 threonylcarbamoyladenosine synthetase subunit TsaC/SUA5/YrdC
MKIPLTATSANLSGSPPLRTAEEVFAHFADPVSRGDLVVVRGCAPGGHASTLVTVENEQMRILRTGAIDEQELVRTIAAAHGLWND